MRREDGFLGFFIKIMSYVLVAVIAAAVTAGIFAKQYTKLDELQAVIEKYFVGEVTEKQLQDGAAAGMVDAMGDRWSFYLSAEEYVDYKDQMSNSYVGIGVTVTLREDGIGFDIISVEPGGGAKEAGVKAGDVIVAVDGQRIAGMDTSEAKSLIKGAENTAVAITLLRGEEELTVDVTRKTIQVVVAQGQMLEEGIGFIQINNFDDRCAQETIGAIEELMEQGAKALIFDVRFNPGGYKHELVKILDYLLPEGVLFRSVYYTGEEDQDTSDADCLDIPMAVLMNGSSYSAAEFFAAALEEYDWAVTVGEPTVGKSYFQNTLELSDGSAVGLSVGKYCTPKGVSLQDEGGLVPGVLVELTEDELLQLQSGELEPAQDPQVRAAVEEVKKQMG